RERCCRECGLPTLLPAQTERAGPTYAPGTAGPRPGLEVVPDPQPFLRPASDPTRPVESKTELTTGSVLRVTSPTMATQMAWSTVMMVGLIVIFAVVGVVLLVMAVKPF